MSREGAAVAVGLRGGFATGSFREHGWVTGEQGSGGIPRGADGVSQTVVLPRSVDIYYSLCMYHSLNHWVFQTP